MSSRRKKPLKRKPAKRDAVRYFNIFSEGENTERDYFSALGATLDSTKVRIKYNGPIGVPKSVAAKAIEFAKDSGLIKGRRGRKPNSYEEKDEVWAVFDRDEFPCYQEAKQMCKGASIPFAYSDPCFEHWLNLHFGPHDAPCGRHEAQGKTKDLLEGYDPKAGKTADFSIVIDRLQNAEELAERQRSDRREENNEDGNPSTNVYELTRKIRAASNGVGKE
ncbi:MAG: RloB family protein [Tateyamaria sp.]|nr:RloB family protein [Tateyamaria sp.]